ncbi:MAG TPA: STAS-like domain-containing protein [Longimicrobiaceae bacterium]|nr:STAS-like domain-containing protein [Longimicrobiaceae bacterium]
MSVVVKLRPAGGFAEDPRGARRIRSSRLRPALEAGESVTLDFGGVDYASHAYVHALIGEADLDRIELRDCSPAVRGVVELVVGNAEAPSTSG